MPAFLVRPSLRFADPHCTLQTVLAAGRWATGGNFFVLLFGGRFRGCCSVRSSSSSDSFSGSILFLFLSLGVFVMGDGWESLIGEALFSGDHEAGLRRASVKSAVCSRISCRCGSILDQRSAVLLHVGPSSGDGPAVMVVCPECFDACDRESLARASAAAVVDHGAGLFAVTWDGESEV